MKQNIFTLILIFFSPNLYSYYNESFYSFDNIVDQLRTTAPKEEARPIDLYEDILFHIGAGVSTSLLNIKSDSRSDRVSLSGVEIRFGMNLFSPFWIAETTLRNYNSNNTRKASYSLKEFEFKIANILNSGARSFYRFSSGISARYLDSDIESFGISKSYTTPSILIGAGYGYKLNPRMSLAADAGFKTALVRDTVDKNNIDFTIRLDTKF